jgi:AAA+ superfamily predicted ATPase
MKEIQMIKTHEVYKEDAGEDGANFLLCDRDEESILQKTYINPHEHLEDHLATVRLMLQRHARQHADRLVDMSSESYTDDCVGRSEVRRVLALGDDDGGQRWLDALGYPPEPVIEERLRELELQMSSRLSATGVGTATSLPLEELRASFQLSDLEQRLLVAASAPRLSMSVSRAYSFAWADFSVKQPTAGFLAELVSTNQQEMEEALNSLESGATLARYRLIVLHEHDRWKPTTPLIHAPVAVPQRVLDFIRGVGGEAAALDGCTLHEGGEELDSLIIEEDARAALMSAMRVSPARVCLQGPQGVGRRTVMRALAEAAGQRLLEVDLSLALTPPESSPAHQRPQILPMLAEVLREARLHNALVLLRMDGIDGHPMEEVLRQRAAAFRALIKHYPGGLAASISDQGQLVAQVLGDFPTVTLRLPAADGQRALWQRALGGHMDAERAARTAGPLARSYRLTPGAIHGAVESTLTHAVRRKRRDQALTSTGLLDAVRRQIDHRLGRLAEPHSVQLDLEDVVMPPDAQAQVAEILRFARCADEVFHGWGFAKHSPQGRGLSVMFSGPPGTGKTLVAGVLARELGRMLYRVDLSRIVDKYIGETEKNLAKVFDEAERAQAMLLFDEADSLFAKRTAVKSSNDRYANLEVNFLLQRLEAFDGVSILTTNFVSSIDEAFQRRIRFKVEFPMPDAKQRAELWRKLLPPGAPQRADIDFERIGEEFELSGGHVRNAVLRAAIEAADEHEPISGEMLWRAGVSECREMGILIHNPKPFHDRQQRR